MIIKARNLSDQNVPETFLTQTEAVGVGTLHTKNINGFSSNWGIQIGKTGEEKSEVVVIGASTPSNGSIILSGTTRFSHPIDTPVYAIKYDQLIFKRSTLGTAGTATAMTNGTVTITPDQEYTQFDDTTGATSYAYRVSFYSSGLDVQSSDSDWLTTSGFAFYSLAKIRDRAKRKLFQANFIKDDDTINDWINEWLEIMNNTVINVNKDYSIGTVDVAFGTSSLGTITSTDFKELRRLWVTYNGTDFYRAKKYNPSSIEPNQSFNSTYPIYYWQGDTVFGIKPENSGGTARISYYKIESKLTNDTDNLPTSMRSYTKGFVDYALSQAYYLDDKSDMGDRFMSQASSGLEKFKDEITPRAKTGVQSMIISESIDGEDDAFLDLF